MPNGPIFLSSRPHSERLGFSPCVSVKVSVVPVSRAHFHGHYFFVRLRDYYSHYTSLLQLKGPVHHAVQKRRSVTPDSLSPDAPHFFLRSSCPRASRQRATKKGVVAAEWSRPEFKAASRNKKKKISNRWLISLKNCET
jgi:hypothetical protein